MRECYALKNPLIEPEWYLARHEVQQAAAKAMIWLADSCREFRRRRARRCETGVYVDELLQHYFPPALAVISNIAAG